MDDRPADTAFPDAPEWAVVDAALDAALDHDGAARDAFVASLSTGLRGALVPLLRDALREDPLLDHAQAVLGPLAAAGGGAPGVAEGVSVGPYRIEALVGEGGMGRVYRAHRADGAFDRTVAVKVVRQSLTLAGSDVAARLRRERDLLATLDHPAIARLVDGGETDDGVPYLVTDFVDGAPITIWADAHALGVRERVRLMVQVARAVAHAHRRFVVHRDLKPSNVMVTETDGAARPVVLDFGIAKLFADAEDAATGAFPLTRTGMQLLTPAYAAPELYDPMLGVTVAVDVYGLGAILYELLAGKRPHGDAPMAPTTEPTRPSKAASDPAPGGTAGATAGATDTAARARALRGDLDVICLKALHPDPARRYASAADVADDLARYLDGRPVEARPDSVAYVAGRFVRRNRGMVAAAALALVALVAGLGASLVSLSREQAARVEAEAAANRADEATRLLTGIFQTANPETGRRDATAREILDGGLARVAAVESDPLRGYLLSILGETYVGIGELVTGDSLLGVSLALLDGQVGMGAEQLDPLRLDYAFTRLRLRDAQGAGHLARRVAAHRSLDDPLGIRARGYLLLLLRESDEVERGVGVAQDLVRGAAAYGDPAVLAEALVKQSEFLVWTAERMEDGIPAARRALVLLDSLHGPDYRATRITTSTLARALSQSGRHAEAIGLYRQSLASTIRVHGSDSQDEAYARVTLGEALLRAGRVREADAELERGITMAQHTLPADHVDIGWWLQTVASVKNRIGSHAEAEVAARRSLAIAERGASVALAGRALGQLGLALAERGQDAEARAVLGRAVTSLQAPAELSASYQQDAAALLAEVRRALRLL